jgi:hypothetical protein
MRSRSGGSARSGRNVWTGYWYSAAATWSESFGPTPPTTTPEGRIEASTWGRRTPRPDLGPLADGARVRRRDVLGGVIYEYELAA